MTSPLTLALATQALRIAAGRLAAAQEPEVQDADPVPAALTAEAQPVFRTVRDKWTGPGMYLCNAARHTAAMINHDAERAEAAARTFREELLIACAKAKASACDPALDVI